MAVRGVLLFAAFMAFPSLAWPCKVAGPLPPAEQLIREAEVIARVRVEGLSPTRGARGIMAESPTQVRFAVLELLKGSLTTDILEFNGALTDADDPNDREVPYDFVRPGGRWANCFALTYRDGAEYLLFLRRGGDASYAQADKLTPYWAPLSPTNEQLRGGASDDWLEWVRTKITHAIAHRP